MWHRSTKRSRKRGATIVETAIAFPVIIVLVMGVIEASLFFQDHELLYNVTRECARRMAVGDSVSTAENYAQTWAASANSTMAQSGNVGFTVQQSPDGSTGSWTTLSSGTATVNDLVRVQATFTHNSVTGFFGGSYQLTATSMVMRVEN